MGYAIANGATDAVTDADTDTTDTIADVPGVVTLGRHALSAVSAHDGT